MVPNPVHGLSRARYEPSYGTESFQRSGYDVDVVSSREQARSPSPPLTDDAESVSVINKYPGSALLDHLNEGWKRGQRAICAVHPVDEHE